MEAKQVHAQKTNPSTALERRVETGAQNSNKVLYYNNDTENILDIASFSNIHRHRQPIVLLTRLEDTIINAEREPPLHRASKPIENGARSHAKCETEKPPEFSSSVSAPSKTKSGIELMQKPSPVLKINAKAKIVTTKPRVNKMNELDVVSPLTDDEQPLTDILLQRQPIVLLTRLEDTIINAEREPPLHRASKPIENGARSHAKCETEKPPEFSSSVSAPSKTKSGIKLMKKPSPVLKKTVTFKKKIDPKAKIVTTKPRVNKMNELDVVSPLTDDEQPLTDILLQRQPIVLLTRLEDTIINAEREPPLHRASKPIENGARSHAKCETEKPPEFSSSVSPPSKTKSGIKLMKKPSPVLKKTVTFKKKIDPKAKIVTTKPRVNKMNELDVVSPLTDDEQPLTDILLQRQPIVLLTRLEDTIINAEREPPLHRASKPIENGARSHAKCETEKPPEFSSSVSPPSKTKSGIKLMKKPSPVLKKTVTFKKKIDPKAKIVTTKPRVNKMNELDVVSPLTDDEQPLTDILLQRQPIVLLTRLEDTIINAEREPPLHRASKPIENGARSHAKCETEKPPEFSSSVSPPSKTKSGIKLMKKPSPVLKKTVTFKKKIDPKAKIVTTKPRVNKMNELDVVSPLTDDEQPLTDADPVDALQRSKSNSANNAPSEKKKVSFANEIAEVMDEHQPARKTRRSHSIQENILSEDAPPMQSKKKKTDCHFPKGVDRAKLVDAPVFYPTVAEFRDPIIYFEKLMPLASQFGICKVVPPADFKPPCVLSPTTRFTVRNQYISRLYTRWGPAFREMCAIRSYLASQNVNFTREPLLEGLEVNLPKMYHTVQRLGGFKNVSDKKKWNRVAEEMHFYQLTNPSKKLEEIYVKYLLPYDTLTNRKRQVKIAEVELMWQKRNKKMLARAINPLQQQKRLLGDSRSDSDSDSQPEAGSDSDEQVASSSHNSDPLAEAEECIVTGRAMNFNNFKKVAENAFKMYTPPNEEPKTNAIETLYWKLVLFGADHVCVNSASVDTGEKGYGFTKNKSNPYSKHPWNLKVISENNGNVLRPLGPVPGLTVPTLHLGMIFSTSCWHRDKHALPWIEYMHQGPEKIWYGIPDEQSDNFRKAVEVLCPTACQNKGIWLSPDTTMIPPNMLLEHNVSLSKITQKPHEFVIVFPKAYSSSICTGYTISESVYFATQSSLVVVSSVFQELRESCEPTTFALEQLVMSVARDGRTPLRVLQTAHAALAALVTAELAARSALLAIGLQVTVNKGTKGERRLTRRQDECEICRSTLYLSKVKGVFGKQSALCVQHAVRVLVEKKKDLDDKRINKDNLELEIFVTKTELEEIEQNLQIRLLS